MVWIAAMNGRHAAARPGPSTDPLMAGVVLAQIVILIAVISMALAG
jgi:multisubunit Na+/H+ antiporter MnhC subunit